jgi:hypothetical protein
MSQIQKCFWAAAALVAAIVIAPTPAFAYGPVRVVVRRPVVRAPLAVVRTVRVATPPYYAPRVYVPQRVYAAPVGGPVIVIR